jgi:hypothetical protein
MDKKEEIKRERHGNDEGGKEGEINNHKSTQTKGIRNRIEE